MALRINQRLLKQIYKSRNMNQKELARELGVSQAALSLIRSGKFNIGPKLIEAFLSKTGYRFDELFYFDQKEVQSGNRKNHEQVV